MKAKRHLPWRVAALVVAGAVLVALALTYRDNYLSRPMGTGPAGPSVEEAPFRETWREQPVLLLGVGDSITAGLGAKSRAHTYFQRLIRNPNDEYADLRGRCLSRVMPKLETLNIAVSGTTSLEHEEILRDKLHPQDESVLGLVVMTTGGNDIIHRYGRLPPREGAMYGATLSQAKPWISKFAARLERMIAMLNERFPGGCEVFLADIYDPTDGVGDATSVGLPNWPDGLAIHTAYNDVIRACGKKHDNVHVTPLHSAFLGHGSHCRQRWRDFYCPEDPHYWFYINVEDPNDRGYDAIRRVFLNSMVQVRQRLN